MGNCMQRNDKVTPRNSDYFSSIGSVHTIRNLSDLKLDFIDNTPDSYTVTIMDTLQKGEVSV
tara:strand:- start:313 stop:498 length:186 start_codon:yes stop_codon:yes gene_type:complete